MRPVHYIAAIISLWGLRPRKQPNFNQSRERFLCALSRRRYPFSRHYKDYTDACHTTVTDIPRRLTLSPGRQRERCLRRAVICT